MPYRRLPNTDQARLRALKAAIQEEEQHGFSEHVVQYKTLLDARNFLSTFENHIFHYQKALENQVNANKKYQLIIHNARLYISHFIQVLNLSVIRGDIKKEHKLLYQLDPEVHTVPDLSTEHALLHWGKCIIEGENERIRKGGLPIYNPAIAKVKVHYEVFKEYKTTQKMYQHATNRLWEEQLKIRQQGDVIIQQMWNQIEEYYQSEEPIERLRRCRKHGVVYYFRKGEKKIE